MLWLRYPHLTGTCYLNLGMHTRRMHQGWLPLALAVLSVQTSYSVSTCCRHLPSILKGPRDFWRMGRSSLACALFRTFMAFYIIFKVKKKRARFYIAVDRCYLHYLKPERLWTCFHNLYFGKWRVLSVSSSSHRHFFCLKLYLPRTRF